ncbi:tyrosine-type recombinase/integrase [Salicibibacter cibarius]|uniref:Tyrosine-type recombinase/integrase n=1 Tax=Salicibibacter cibarius TaxID=2743000 RepID=A0A7T7CBG6_9BACI|nr:tyrosine-type recombinase/integrase [Salicibibacter cibarius]QQK75843.1 tyrosine-type recombinase/integrase [Salicibibacter cibarius]
MQSQKERNYWTKKEVNDFLRRSVSVLSTDFRTLFRVLLFSGTRKGEAVALTWNDVDFRNNTIRVNKTLSMDYGEVQRPKTSSAHRLISLDD